MKKVLSAIILVLIILVIVLLWPKRSVNTVPIRQSQEIRSDSNSNDQEAVQAIEQTVPK